MTTLQKTEAHVVVERDCQALDLFGPTVQFLTEPQPNDETPCAMKGTIPPGGFVPIHRHPDFEAFLVLSGNVEVFSGKDKKPRWITAGPGEFIQVPSNAIHGFRNRSSEPTVQLITTTSKLGRFFQEIGRSMSRGSIETPPTPDELQHFIKTAERYGYWLASPEENAAAGIQLF